ncbi:MAG: alpha-L-fucosidase [Armatimonadota bacterium]|nr:alpha-L-fucosidase [Armatimonadota bacterium]
MKPAHHRAKWMADGSYGVMVHYLLSPAGETLEAKTAELNRIIDAFDLDTFVKQFEESGADWLIFTIGQNTGYYNSSNSVTDRLIPGRTPKRDLVMEMAQRVKKLKKRFIVYFPAPLESPTPPDIQQAFGWNQEDQTHFFKRYHNCIRAYSEKFGSLCDGWWFDGCYDWISKGRWDWSDWIAPARAGNPNSIVALNDGAFCVAREKPVSPRQDYHAGEVHLLHKGQIVFGYPPEGGFKISRDGRLLYEENPAKLYMPKSQYIDGVQWHALVPMDSSFNAPTIPYSACHYSDEELLQFLRGCKSVKGAVTFNAPIDINGHIPAETAAQLKRIGKVVR